MAVSVGRMFVYLLVAVLLLAMPAGAQRGGSSVSRSGTVPLPGPTNSPNTTTPGPTRTPGTGTPGGPVFLSGRVAFDDGSPANPNIRIERVCGTTVRLEAHTDSKGRFSFQVGQNNAFDLDASDQTSGVRVPGASGGTPLGNLGSTRSGSTSTIALSACEIRASYPGYRSDSINLAGRQSLDAPDLGTIVLHRLANVQGTTLSATTLAAPKHAQKAYDKAMQLLSKGKLEEAEQHLLEATDAYPQYAIAWFSLGQIRQKTGRTDEARKAYTAAVTADSKYVSPYDQLALISAQQQKWDEAASYSGRVIELNPVEFPDDYWYNAMANFNLKKSAEAEKSVRQLLAHDTHHLYPQAEEMLAELLLNKGDVTEAAHHMRAYLAAAPNARDADAIKELLSKIDQKQADQAPAPH
ncbi:MAG: tetratricopeptide repeat protein [Acidobacteriaceae bacterium]|nr:tetratricopeptide repeat protein [Acidobacteriaceae bacterium]